MISERGAIMNKEARKFIELLRASGLDKIQFLYMIKGAAVVAKELKD